MNKKELIETFDYNPITGDVFRKSNFAQCKCRGKRGYYIVSYKNKRYYLHRLIWVMMNEAIPDNYVVDHINRNRTDNRITNLRCISKKQNNQNLSLRKTNKSGYRGIMWNKATQSWRVRIMKKHIGMYKRIEDAVKSRKVAEKQFFV